MSRRKDKTVRSQAASAEGKSIPCEAISGIVAERHADECLAWRFQLFGGDGNPFGVGAFTGKDAAKLMGRLGNFESQAHRTFVGGHPDTAGTKHPLVRYDLSDAEIPNPKARRHLGEILPDATEIFRFSFGDTWRLFGLIRGDLFYVLWWDPKHEIWPDQNFKKHRLH